MIQIGNTLVSFDIFDECFCCDLQQCRGICCVDGDSGAPLEEGEIREIEKNYATVKNFMTPAGIKAVEEQGFSVIDSEGDVVTPLVNMRECAYAVEENGIFHCAIEKAWNSGESDFRKPLSCHLYPIRITVYPELETLNYNKWDICSCARLKGEQQKTPLYRFLKEALIARYGAEWYSQLEYAAREIESGRIEIPPR